MWISAEKNVDNVTEIQYNTCIPILEHYLLTLRSRMFKMGYTEGVVMLYVMYYRFCMNKICLDRAYVAS